MMLLDCQVAPSAVQYCSGCPSKYGQIVNVLEFLRCTRTKVPLHKVWCPFIGTLCFYSPSLFSADLGLVQGSSVSSDRVLSYE